MGLYKSNLLFLPASFIMKYGKSRKGEGNMERLLELGGMAALVYLAALNALTFLVYGWDKLCAKREGARRVPEKTLLFLAVVGGSVGAIAGMNFFRHKTRHAQFRFGLPLILALQIGLLAWGTVQK